MKQLYSILFFLWAVAPALAEVELADASGLVGEQMYVPVVLHGEGGEAVVRAVLKLGNPTVFYPERFVAVQANVLQSARLARLTDSTWTVELRVQYETGDTVCVLRGEALAGSGAQCELVLQQVEVNDLPWPDASGMVSVTSVGTPLPYVRFARLEQNYPNPAIRGEITTWVYRIDKVSEVHLILYNYAGRTVDILRFGVQQPGVHRVPYHVSGQMATGLYWAQLITTSGLSSQPFFIMP